jgi:hypothetical protein
MWKCEKNITEQRMDEDEEQRVTDEKSWILLGMPTATVYKKLATECRNCGEKVMAGVKCYFELDKDVLTFGAGLMLTQG